MRNAVESRMRSVYGADGHGEADPRPATVARLDPDPAAVRLDDRAADRQAEARARAVARAVASAEEALEDALGVLGRDALAVVRDLDAHVVVLALGAQRDGAVLRRVPHRVLHEVVQHALELLGVAADRGDVARDALCQHESLALRLGAERLDGLVDQLGDADPGQRPRDVAGLEPCELEEVVDQRRERRDVALRAPQRVGGLFGPCDDAVVDRLDEQPQRREGRAQVVRDGGDQVAPGPVGVVSLGSHALEHGCHLVGRGGQVAQLARAGRLDPVRQVARRERPEAGAQALDVAGRALGEQRRVARADHPGEEHERAEHRGVVVGDEHPIGGPEHGDEGDADGARHRDRVLQAERAEATHAEAEVDDDEPDRTCRHRELGRVADRVHPAAREQRHRHARDRNRGCEREDAGEDASHQAASL